MCSRRERVCAAEEASRRTGENRRKGETFRQKDGNKDCILNFERFPHGEHEKTEEANRWF